MACVRRQYYWVKWLFTSPVNKLNVTVIEFSVTALTILSQMKYERLAPEAPVVNEVVSVFQYLKEGYSLERDVSIK